MAWNQRRVLVVDDDRDNADTLARLLQRLGASPSFGSPSDSVRTVSPAPPAKINFMSRQAPRHSSFARVASVELDRLIAQTPRTPSSPNNARAIACWPSTLSTNFFQSSASRGAFALKTGEARSSAMYFKCLPTAMNFSTVITRLGSRTSGKPPIDVSRLLTSPM